MVNNMFKKKKKEIIDSKYKINQFVHFKGKHEMMFGVIVNIKKIDDKIYYDVNVGGEAPYIVNNLEEDKLIIIDKNNI